MKVRTDAKRDEIMEVLETLWKEHGLTFIMVTHDQDEAMSLSTRVAVMNAGRIVQTGAPQEIYDHPADRFVAGFVGSPPTSPVKRWRKVRLSG